MQSVIHLTSGTFDLFPPVYAVQNDTGRTLKMIVDDVTYTNSDTGELYFKRSDGSYYNVATTFSSTDNSFEADITQALTQPGRTRCQLKVEDTNGDVVSTFSFVIVVQLSTDGVPSEQLGISPEDLMEAASQLTLSDNDVKLALLQIAEKVVYLDEHGQEYYDALEDALYPPVRATSVTLNKNSLVFGGVGGTDTLVATVSPNNVEDDTVYWGSSDKTVAVVSDGIVTATGIGSATITATCGTKHASATVSVAQAELLSIEATYTQSGVVYTTDSLDDLKADLVVVATWDNSTQTTVSPDDYVLSGTLTAGASTITVTYGGKTDTFTVTVTEQLVPAGYTSYDYITYDYALGSTSINNAIVTNIAMKSEYTYETEISYVCDGSGAANATECVMGVRNGVGGAKELALFVNRATTKLGYWYDGTDSSNTINNTAGIVNEIAIQPVGASSTYPTYATIKLNGTDYSTGSTSTGKTWQPWFAFFGYGNATGSASNTNKYQLKIGRTIVKGSDNTPVYDFVPAKNSSDICGFYERINGTFFTGADASHFLCGDWS